MKSKIQSVLDDITAFPTFSSSIQYIVKRNFIALKNHNLISLVWLVCEPSLYLFAIGKCVGALIGEVQGRSYYDFFFPALVMGTAMIVSFFESSFGSFDRLKRQKVFHTLSITPITPSAIALGEIGWSILKAGFSVIGLSLLTLLMSDVSISTVVVLLPIAFLTAWVFSSFGLLLTTYFEKGEQFVSVQTAVILPMFLLSGTFFPLNELPQWIQDISLLFPFTHSVACSRLITRGLFTPELLLHLGILVFLGVFLTNWATARFQRHLLR